LEVVYWAGAAAAAAVAAVKEPDGRTNGMKWAGVEKNNLISEASVSQICD
jgi:hypothetical protein